MSFLCPIRWFPRPFPVNSDWLIDLFCNVLRCPVLKRSSKASNLWYFRIFKTTLQCRLCNSLSLQLRIKLFTFRVWFILLTITDYSIPFRRWNEYPNGLRFSTANQKTAPASASTLKGITWPCRQITSFLSSNASDENRGLGRLYRRRGIPNERYLLLNNRLGNLNKAKRPAPFPLAIFVFYFLTSVLVFRSS